MEATCMESVNHLQNFLDSRAVRWKPDGLEGGVSPWNSCWMLFMLSGDLFQLEASSPVPVATASTDQFHMSSLIHFHLIGTHKRNKIQTKKKIYSDRS